MEKNAEPYTTFFDALLPSSGDFAPFRKLSVEGKAHMKH